VRELIHYGAQFIKIANDTVGVYPAVNPDRPLFTREELEAVVDEAHRAGLRVSCHCEGSDGRSVTEAVEAGVDTIEHGITIPEDTVKMMAARGTYYVPTLANTRAHADGWFADAFGSSESYLENARRADAMHAHTLALCLEHGVKVAMGSDLVCGMANGVYELDYLVEYGMSPFEALIAATRTGAELMGLEGSIGTLEVGKQADLLIVDGDPLSDVGVLHDLDKLSLVMLAGQPVAGSMQKQFPWRNPGWPKGYHPNTTPFTGGGRPRVAVTDEG